MPEPIRRVRPRPTDRYLGNPHKGCCTFQHFNGDELFPGTSWSEEGPLSFPPPVEQPYRSGYLPSTVAYCRWFWRTLEPEQGRPDFAPIEGALRTCAERGQTLAVRLMAYGSPKQPAVPEWYLRQYPTEVQKLKSAPQQIPVHDAPEYLEHWGGFVRAFAQRFDGDPLLESIDVTYIGPWGEGEGECSAAQCARFAQLWRESFPNTPRLGLVSGEQMRAALATGAGWRCDCYGDLIPAFPVKTGAMREPWNHMYDMYPRAVVTGGAQDAWRMAPVHLETCGVPMTWHERGYDLDFILEQGLKYHATYFMPKYTRLPEAWMEKLSAFCRRLGYRFVLRSASYDPAVAQGGSFHFEAWIENVGVAPIYRRYDLLLRLTQGGRSAYADFPEVDIRRWLPGDAWVERAIALPEGFGPGRVELALALAAPCTHEPKVRFAVEEDPGDGWVRLGALEVTAFAAK